jgi:tyrosyl-tRNA synthetase
MAEVRHLSALAGAEVNEAKKILANEATALLHGRAAADAAAETARKTFEEGASAEGLPSVALPRAAFDAGAPLLEQFIATGLIASKGEGRRHIAAGALKVNDIPLTEERLLAVSDLKDGAIKLSIGKKKHALVRVAG